MTRPPTRRTAMLGAGLSLLAHAARTAPDDEDFAWLDGQHDPAAVAWARARTEAAMASLTASPAFPAVAREMRERLADSAPFPTVYLLGARYVRLVRDAEHPAGRLQTAPRRPDGRPGAWRTVLDVGALNRQENADYALGGVSLFDFASRALPPAFDRCLLPLSPGGSSSLELREFDLAAGAFVADGFRVPANRAVTAWLDADTLLIGHSLFGSPALPSNFPAVVRLWRRGEPLAAARPVFQSGPETSILEVAAFGGGADRRGVLKVIRDYATIDYHLVDRDGGLSRIDLPRKVKYVGQAAMCWPHIAVQLAEPAVLGGRTYPAEAIVACDVRPTTAPAARHSMVFRPEPGVYVTEGLDATGQGVAFIADRGLRKSLMIARPGDGGWTATRALSAPPGVALQIVQPDGVGAALLVRQEGFLTPPTLTLVEGARRVPVAAARPILDASGFVVEIHTARARDGTPIDYYLVRPRRSPAGPVPTLMSGYGAFGVDFDPDYFASGLGRGLASWLTRGGAYVAAAIRGGGERGEAWHLAGAGVHKPTAFDDFAAVAEDLIARGFTVPTRLGALGRSAGGLLTAAMAARRPDLFGALYVGVPVTDVAALAASSSGIIKGQKAEFGDWDDPQGLRAILAWSPLQALRPGVRYPRILILTSTEDNQVGPGQARRFAARLEALGAHPLLIEAPQGGHGAPDPLRQPQIAAAQTVFFIDALMR